MKERDKLIKEVKSVLENAFYNEEEYKRLLNYILECNLTYSLNNMALLYTHFDHPVVKTQKQWEEAGYHVQVSYKEAARLLAPYHYEGFWVNKKWVSLKKASPTQREMVKQGKIRLIEGLTFRPFSVYDITQTDADQEKILVARQEQITKPHNLQRALDLNGVGVDELIDRVKHRISLSAVANEVPRALRPMYESTMLFMIGKYLGFDPTITSFHLLNGNGEIGYKEIEPMMKKILKTSTRIAEGFLEQ